MKRQVVQDFLNLPGIAGVALMDGRTRPFFYGLDTTLNSQQKDALAQGIQQVVSTTPDDFDAFSFRFSSRQAHIYKLKEGVILLVMTSDQSVYEQYLAVLKQLQGTLIEDPINAVATFRLLAGCVTLDNQAYAIEGSTKGTSETGAVAGFPANPARSQTAVCGDIVEALNHLSDFTTQYLGKVIVANTWKSARPAHPWLESFEVDRTGHFKLKSSEALSDKTGLTPEQHQWLKDWVRAYIDHCGKIVRNFATIVPEKALDPHQRQLLLSSQA